MIEDLRVFFSFKQYIDITYTKCNHIHCTYPYLTTRHRTRRKPWDCSAERKRTETRHDPAASTAVVAPHHRTSTATTLQGSLRWSCPTTKTTTPATRATTPAATPATTTAVHPAATPRTAVRRAARTAAVAEVVATSRRIQNKPQRAPHFFAKVRGAPRGYFNLYNYYD
jgi:hypothetical protein